MLIDLTPAPISEAILDHKEIWDKSRPVRLGIGLYTGNPKIGPFSYFVEDVREMAMPVPFPRHLTQYEESLPECDRQSIVDTLWEKYHLLSRQYTRKMRKLYTQKYQRNWCGDPGGYGVGYGICDYPEQVVERYPHYGDDNLPRAIFFQGIAREAQDSWGGFRYHKWGTYIGKQRPRHEYLYDDKHIDLIWVFQIYDIHLLD